MICFIFWKILLAPVENMVMERYADSRSMSFLWCTLEQSWACWLVGRMRKLFSLTLTDHDGNGSEMEHSLNSAVYSEVLVGESWWTVGPFALLFLFMYLS